MTDSRQAARKTAADEPVTTAAGMPAESHTGTPVADILPLHRTTQAAHDGHRTLARHPSRLDELRWAITRLAFYGYIGFALFSVIGGYLTAPLMTWLFYNDWRFWRYWRRAWRLFPHGWHIAWQALSRNADFMFSVPLTSPPRTVPDHELIELSPAWPHGTSCGDCQRCCVVQSVRCPVLDVQTGFCTGYDSFYWRYFNCGRYPTRATEIRFYGCNKWRMKG